MDYKTMVCEAMSNYTFIKVSIDNMRYAITHDFEPRGLSGLSYDRDVVQTSTITSETESDGIRLADSKTKLERELKVNESLIKKLDRCIESLPPKHRELITLKYIRCKSGKEIADEMGYSVSHCKRIHQGAIYKMSVGMYGLRAVRNKTEN